MRSAKVQEIGCFGKVSKSIYPAKADSKWHATSGGTSSAAEKEKRREKGGRRQNDLRFVRTHN